MKRRVMVLVFIGGLLLLAVFARTINTSDQASFFDIDCNLSDEILSEAFDIFDTYSVKTNAYLKLRKTDTSYRNVIDRYPNLSRCIPSGGEVAISEIEDDDIVILSISVLGKYSILGRVVNHHLFIVVKGKDSKGMKSLMLEAHNAKQICANIFERTNVSIR